MASHALNSSTDTQNSYSAPAVIPQTARPLEPSVAAPARRRIPPVSGHPLEKLGHAIEYLTDEYLHDGCPKGQNSPRVEAIQLLMAANRGIYFECPVVPSLSERIRALFSASLRHAVLPQNSTVPSQGQVTVAEEAMIS